MATSPQVWSANVIGNPPDWLDALLYDWHNKHLLRRQRQDEAFYSELLADKEAVVVLGSGTGRVSAAISRRCSGTVFAVDRSIARLARASHQHNVVAVGADFRALPFVDHLADAALYPYSAFQLLESREDRLLALTCARRTLRADGILLVDISTNFENRSPGRQTRLVLEATCPELEATVTEVELSERMDDHLMLTHSFRRDGRQFAEFIERWFFAGALQLEELLGVAGLKVSEVLHGYGDDSTSHRRIYVARPA
jgi:SAM-dependent methyltransferase